MTDTPKPLTADDVTMLKRVYAKHDDIQHLIATIEQRDEQIVLLRNALIEAQDVLVRAQPRTVGFHNQIKHVLAATEQKP